MAKQQNNPKFCKKDYMDACFPGFIQHFIGLFLQSNETRKQSKICGQENKKQKLLELTEVCFQIGNTLHKKIAMVSSANNNQLENIRSAFLKSSFTVRIKILSVYLTKHV